MARKKEPERLEINKAKIVEVSKKLFLQKGILQTSMEDIARETHICKATLYGCYPNREAIRDDISLEAMRYLYRILAESTDAGNSSRDNFMAVCRTLLKFKEEYPLSFRFIVENISVDNEVLKENTTLREIYETGEKVNDLLIDAFSAAFRGKSRKEVIVRVFELWGSIYGLISVADSKVEYIQKATGKSRDEFLQNGFKHLYLQVEGSTKHASDLIYRSDVLKEH